MEIKNGILYGNKIDNDEMPYVKLMLGWDDRKGVVVDSVKDSGATSTVIHEKLWQILPNRKLIPTERVNCQLTVANNQEIKIKLIAHITITFFGKDGRHFSIKHPVLVVPDLQFGFYLGNDLISSNHKIFETSSTMILASDPTLVKQIVLPYNPNLFEIEIFNVPKNSISIKNLQKTQKRVRFKKLQSLSIEYTNESRETVFPQMEPLSADLINYDSRNGKIPIAISQLSMIDTAECETPPIRVDMAYNSHNFDKPDLVEYTPKQLIEGINLKHLKDKEAKLVRKIFTRQIDCLARNELDVTANPLIQGRIHLKNPEPKVMNSNYIPIKPELMAEADQLIQYYLDKGILEYSKIASPFISNLHFVKKKSGKIRATLDSRIINDNTEKLSMSLTSHNEILSLISGTNHLTSVDVSNAYFATSLDPESAAHTSFFDHRQNRLNFTCTPQGFINSGYYLDLLLSKILSDITSTHWFADDIIIATSGSFEDHMKEVEKVLKRLKKAKLRLNHKKISIDAPETEILGIIYKKQKMSIPEKRIKEYLELPVPKNAKQIKSQVASQSYYRKFIRSFSEITKPLHDLAKSKEIFKWNSKAQEAHDRMKKAIRKIPSLHIPIKGEPFECFVRSSKIALSFDIFQRNKNGELQPISFNSRLTTPAEQAYSPYRLELTAILHGLDTYKYFFENSEKIIIHANIKAFLLLRLAKDSNTCLARNALTAANYNMVIYNTDEPIGMDELVLSKINPALDVPENEREKCVEKMDDERIFKLLNDLTLSRRAYSIAEVEELVETKEMPTLIAQPRRSKSKKVIPFLNARKYKSDSQISNNNNSSSSNDSSADEGRAEKHLPFPTKQRKTKMGQKSNRKNLSTIDNPIPSTSAAAAAADSSADRSHSPLTTNPQGGGDHQEVSDSQPATATAADDRLDTASANSQGSGYGDANLGGEFDPNVLMRTLSNESTVTMDSVAGAPDNGSSPSTDTASEVEDEMVEGEGAAERQHLTLSEMRLQLKMIKDGNISLETLRNSQILDGYFGKFIAKIKNGENVNNFELQDDILLRKLPSGELKICLSENLLEYIFNYEHYSPAGAHRSAPQIARTLQQTYYARNMLKFFRQLAQKCYFCITNTANTNRKGQALSSDIQITGPRQVWSLDLAGGFNITTKQNSMILVYVDNFSLYTILRPIKTKSAEELISRIKNDIIGSHCSPFAIRCDGEGAIVQSQLAKEFFATNEITLLNTAANAPYSNGLVEGRIRVIKNLARTCIAASSTKEWDLNLHLLQNSINQTCSTYGFSPEALHYGNENPRPTDPLRVQGVPMSHQEYMQCIKERLLLMQAQVTAARNKHREQNERNRNEKKVMYDYKEGQICYLMNHLISSPGALVCKKKGPFCIVQVSTHGRTCLIRNIVSGRVTKAHFADLVPATESRLWPKLNSNWQEPLTDFLQNQQH